MYQMIGKVSVRARPHARRQQRAPRFRAVRTSIRSVVMVQRALRPDGRMDEGRRERNEENAKRQSEGAAVLAWTRLELELELEPAHMKGSIH